MTAIDLAVLRFLNAYAGRWPGLDSLAVHVSESHFLKGAIIIALFWWAMYTVKPGGERERSLLALLPVAMVAVAAGRILVFILPFRMRPILTPGLGLHATSIQPSFFMDWNSLPSDHAIIFTAISFGILYVSRALGVTALLYTCVVILLPRLYLALHWPSDVAAGAVVGWLLSLLTRIPAVPRIIGGRLQSWRCRYSGPFAAAAFLFSYEVATMFDEVRQLSIAVWHRAAVLIHTGMLTNLK